MSVVKVKITSWDGNESIDGVEYRLSYLITTDDREDGPSVVKAALPVSLDSVYQSGNDSDSRAVLTGVSVTQVDPADFYNWNVDSVYKSTELRTSPLLEPVQESVSWNGVESPTFTFFDGSLILNTAGMGLDEKVSRIDNRPVVTYSLNQLVFPFALAAQVRNSVNSTTWKGFGPRTVRLQSMQTERIFDGRFGAGPLGVYYKVSYTFEINPETHDIAISSMGLHKLGVIDARPARAAVPGRRRFVPAVPEHIGPVPLLEGGIQIKIPVGLDAAGQITSGIPPANPIAIITGQIYEPLDYNPLFSFLV